MYISLVREKDDQILFTQSNKSLDDILSGIITSIEILQQVATTLLMLRFFLTDTEGDQNNCLHVSEDHL